jgi:hypothetical protein
MSDTLVCWICRRPIHRLEKRVQAERGVYHRTCWPGTIGGMWKDIQWKATGGYPPYQEKQSRPSRSDPPASRAAVRVGVAARAADRPASRRPPRGLP